MRRDPHEGGVITLITDFGVADPFVGVMKGVIAGIHRPTLVIDITHDIARQDVDSGAFVLARSFRYFPRGTVHLAVVDPGVGTTRKPMAVEYNGHYFVGPDNGLLSLAAPRGRAIHLNKREFYLSPLSSTFHGRDVFAPAAARLAAGMKLTDLGSPLTSSERVRIRLPAVRRRREAIRGSVISIDRFGNLITNIEPRHLDANPARRIAVRIAGKVIDRIRTSYGMVADGELLAVFGGYGLLEIAVRNGSAQATLKARKGELVIIEGVGPSERDG